LKYQKPRRLNKNVTGISYYIQTPRTWSSRPRTRI